MKTRCRISGMLLVALAVMGGVWLAGAVHAGTAAYRNTVLADNPVVYFECDETTGSTATNIGSLGATYNGTIGGGVALAQGSFTNGGTAFDFTSTADHIVLGSKLPSLLTEWTVEHWMKWDDAGDGANEGTWGQDRSGFNNDAFGGVGVGAQIPTDNVGVQLHVTGSVYKQAYTPIAPPIYPGVWHHVVFTGSVSAGELKVYIDGSLVASNLNLAGAGTLDNGEFIAVGDIGPSRGYPFEGLIDEFALYDAVLDLTRVQAHYNAGIASAATRGMVICVK